MRKPGLPKLTRQNMEDAPEDTRYVESIKSTVNETARQVENIRSENHGIKLLENADVELVDVEVQVPDPWVSGTALNTWTGPLRYYKDHLGVVELRFNLENGASNTIFVMPVGYRPAESVAGFSVDVAGGNHYYFTIATNGTVTLEAGTSTDPINGNIRYLSLDATPIPLKCWPKLIKTKFKHVSGVIVAQAVDDETSKTLPSGSLSAPVWEMTTQGGFPQIKLLNIAGLPYNRKSRVSLLVIGGSNGK